MKTTHAARAEAAAARREEKKRQEKERILLVSFNNMFITNIEIVMNKIPTLLLRFAPLERAQSTQTSWPKICAVKLAIMAGHNGP
jgi:hypothetical protein